MKYDHKKDKEIWRKKFPHGLLTSKLVKENDKLYYPCEDEYLYCIDASTGDILWKTNTAGTPSRLSITNEHVYVIGGSDIWIHRINKNTGEKDSKYRLRIKYKGKPQRVSYFDDNLAIITNGETWFILNPNAENSILIRKQLTD